jgi:hypothetical protein
MNQITSPYDPMGSNVNAVLGLHPEVFTPIPIGWTARASCPRTG